MYRPREDERLSWPGWLTSSGRLTHISGHPSATGRAQDGERTLARDCRSTAEPRGPTAYVHIPDNLDLNRKIQLLCLNFLAVHFLLYQYS